MRMWQQLDFLALLDTLASLLLAFVLGSLVGLERQYRQRTAGLRTNVLVAVGAALFVNLAQRIYDLHGGSYGVVHVVAYIVSGIGFLGAGVIMRESGNIRGINTAATLWGVAGRGRLRRRVRPGGHPRRPLRAGRQHPAASPGQPDKP